MLSLVEQGEMSITEAEMKLVGYVTGDAGRYDAARVTRRGIPEAIYAPGKTGMEVAELAKAALESTGHAIVSRVDADSQSLIEKEIDSQFPDASLEFFDRSSTIVIHGSTYEDKSIEASVGIVSAGTADAGPVEEARIVIEEIGATPVLITDVGVANLSRMIDQLPRIRSCDVIIVAAGREGALPTVVAGLVDKPVIGLPISSGYGHGGAGEAALLGMLQSCTALTVVNIDAGFVAGAQAALIAQTIDSVKESSTNS